MDILGPERRSANMRAIRARDTRPELAVRRALREAGFTGYRLHRKDLPGKPDIAFVGRKKAILVHGCFWHGHDCREGLRRPHSRRDYWLPKISGNQARDAKEVANLNARGWSVLVVWECEISDPTLASRLSAFMARFLLATRLGC
jgi:DNA mismatch endonuclease (patch repair protein)